MLRRQLIPLKFSLEHRHHEKLLLQVLRSVQSERQLPGRALVVGSKVMYPYCHPQLTVSLLQDSGYVFPGKPSNISVYSRATTSNQNSPHEGYFPMSSNILSVLDADWLCQLLRTANEKAEFLSSGLAQRPITRAQQYGTESVPGSKALIGQS